jgi:hypothetical protein
MRSDRRRQSADSGSIGHVGHFQFCNRHSSSSPFAKLKRGEHLFRTRDRPPLSRPPVNLRVAKITKRMYAFSLHSHRTASCLRVSQLAVEGRLPSGDALTLRHLRLLLVRDSVNLDFGGSAVRRRHPDDSQDGAQALVPQQRRPCAASGLCNLPSVQLHANRPRNRSPSRERQLGIAASGS